MSPLFVRRGVDNQLNVFPLIELILSRAFGITFIFSFKEISEVENAVISPPT